MPHDDSAPTNVGHLLTTTNDPLSALSRMRLPRKLDVWSSLGLVLLLGIWGLVTIFVTPLFLPTPVEVARRLISDFFGAPSLEIYRLSDTSLFGNALYTLSNVLIGVVIGSLAGLLLGLTAARINVIRAIVSPIMAITLPLPVIITSPFLLVWFGIGRHNGIVLTVLFTSMLLAFYTQRAADNLEPVYERAAVTLGARRKDILFDVLLPGILPEVLTGVRLALAAGWGLQAFAEILGSRAGLGHVIIIWATIYDIGGIIAAVVLLSMMAVALDAAVVAGVRRIIRWREA